MNNLDQFDVVEMKQAELETTEGGFAFLVGVLIGIGIGAIIAHF